MRNSHPLFDPTTHYRIELQGRVDVEWLQTFDSTVKIMLDDSNEMEGVTVLSVHTDQSGIVGFVRRLHGLGMSILQLQVVSESGNAIQVE